MQATDQRARWWVAGSVVLCLRTAASFTSSTTSLASATMGEFRSACASCLETSCCVDLRRSQYSIQIPLPLAKWTLVSSLIGHGDWNVQMVDRSSGVQGLRKRHGESRRTKACMFLGHQLPLCLRLKDQRLQILGQKHNSMRGSALSSTSCPGRTHKFPQTYSPSWKVCMQKLSSCLPQKFPRRAHGSKH